jgi:hypothetical protein
MPAGTFSAGAGGAGFDPFVHSVSRDAQAPSAVFFDGLRLDYPLDASGRFVEIHPIDAAVFTALRTRLGSVLSATATGQDFSNLQYINPLKIVAQVTDAVRVALSPWTSTGKIQIIEIALDTSVRTRIMVQVTYTNLALGKRVVFSLGGATASTSISPGPSTSNFVQVDTTSHFIQKNTGNNFIQIDL